MVLVDVVEGIPQGKALDLAQAGPVHGYDSALIGSNGYDETADSDIVVITAGLARKPGMTRDDLLFKNAEIVGSVVEQVVPALAERHPDPGHQPARRHGAARVEEVGLPHRARDRHGRRARLGALPHVHRPGAQGLGGERDRVRAGRPRRHHGAAAALLHGGGHPDHRSPAGRIASGALSTRTANGGAEIVALLKTGSAYYAPAASAVEMVEAILKDKKKILPCAAYLNGQYGVKGLYVGVPVKLGPEGRRADHRDQADRRRAGRVRQVGRRGARARRQAEAVGRTPQVACARSTSRRSPTR